MTARMVHPDHKTELLTRLVNERYALFDSKEAAFKDALLNEYSTELYSLVIKNAVEKIPQKLKQTAYYPYAGTDAVWGACGSDLLLLEDAFYDAKTPACKNHHREFKSPSSKLTQKLFNKYHSYGWVHEGTHLELSKRSSRNGAPLEKLDDTLLIYKKAGSKATPKKFMLDYGTRPETLGYGSIVISGHSPELDSFMDGAGYSHVSCVTTDVNYDSSECGLFPKTLSTFVKTGGG